MFKLLVILFIINYMPDMTFLKMTLHKMNFFSNINKVHNQIITAKFRIIWYLITSYVLITRDQKVVYIWMTPAIFFCLNGFLLSLNASNFSKNQVSFKFIGHIPEYEEKTTSPSHKKGAFI